MVGGLMTMLDEQIVTGSEFVTPRCQRDECTAPLPLEGEPGYHRMRKYCDEHQPSQSSGAKKRRAKLTPNDAEPAPKSVINNNFTIKPTPSRSSKPSSEIAELETAATEMLNLIPMVLALTGDAVCTPEIANAIPNIAHQLAILSKYHPFIKKMFLSGEGSGEFMAWLGLLIVTSPVLVTVLAHHNVISGKIAERLATAVAVGGVVAQAVTSDVEETSGDIAA
jgi:hypothetical protein